MALKDFEEYLLFTEYASENLYFILWLRDYTQSYNLGGESSSSSQKASSAGDLAIRFSRALTTFFDSSSTLALNLPDSLSAPIIGLTSYHSHPDPQVFDDVHDHVRNLLDHSLARFIKRSYGNADKNRSMFSVMGGVGHIMIATLVVVFALLSGAPRALRLVAYPVYLIGFLLLFAGAHGLCVLIFIFAGADARQLYPYELAAPRIPDSVVAVTEEKVVKELTLDRMLSGPPTTTYLNSFCNADADEQKIGTSAKSISDYGEPMQQHRDRNGLDRRDLDLERGSNPDPSVPDLLYTASFIPSGAVSHATTVFGPPGLEGNTRGGETSPVSFVFDFDALPMPPPHPSRKDMSHQTTKRRKGSSSTRSFLSRSSPTFGGLTRILSPIIVRGNRDIALRSFLASCLVTSMLMVVVLSIPVVGPGIHFGGGGSSTQKYPGVGDGDEYRSNPRPYF
ncbi:hypothetical protein FRB97_007920 [Tulasnella sp. 331]|nr:hypothetical protein FRB97_007920 [Tulasnella sp. 331]KAG8890279.1 hypothetical protein FRB98_000190 [Tulasnella sp. 332]